MHVVDPMHNLLLGISKHAFETWLGQGVLNENQLSEIEKRIPLLRIPSDLGRLPLGITKYYKTMKADQWKHWTMLHSYFCLKEILPQEHYAVWCLFANACRLLCKQYISDYQNLQAHSLLKMYCIKFEELYGREACVPNHHMSLHLKDCITDFGPTYSFWCFSFERYNGILGDFNLI